MTVCNLGTMISSRQVKVFLTRPNVLDALFTVLLCAHESSDYYFSVASLIKVLPLKYKTLHLLSLKSSCHSIDHLTKRLSLLVSGGGSLE